MIVSICVVALNEEMYIKELLIDLYNQTYDHKKSEIVLIDSGSEDNTKNRMLDFRNAYEGEYYSVQVLDNSKRIQAAGWNVAITNALGDVIIRIDAHSHIPKEFVAKNMKLHEDGEYVTGGVRPCLIRNPTPWKKTLLEVENSLFGSSIGVSRHSKQKKYVRSMFHAAYRREVFEKTGLFNEKLLRTEDNEMHYRIRKAGYKLCFDPDIVSYQYARSSLKSMVKQKYGNGYWVGITLKVCPGCISLYHFVPFAFVLGIVFVSILACFGIWQTAALMWGLYLLFIMLSEVMTVVNRRGNRLIFLMPVLFFILHLSYGIGTVMGFLYLVKRQVKNASV